MFKFFSDGNIDIVKKSLTSPRYASYCVRGGTVFCLKLAPSFTVVCWNLEELFFKKNCFKRVRFFDQTPSPQKKNLIQISCKKKKTLNFFECFPQKASRHNDRFCYRPRPTAKHRFMLPIAPLTESCSIVFLNLTDTKFARGFPVKGSLAFSKFVIFCRTVSQPIFNQFSICKQFWKCLCMHFDLIR